MYREEMGLQVVSSLFGSNEPGSGKRKFAYKAALTKRNEEILAADDNPNSTKLLLTTHQIISQHPYLYYEAIFRGIPIVDVEYINGCIKQEKIINVHQFGTLDALRRHQDKAITFSSTLSGMTFGISLADFDDRQRLFLLAYIESNGGEVIMSNAEIEQLEAFAQGEMTMTTIPPVALSHRRQTRSKSRQAQYFLCKYNSRVPQHVTSPHRVTIQFLDDCINGKAPDQVPSTPLHFPFKTHEVFPSKASYENMVFGVMIQNVEDTFDVLKVLKVFGWNHELFDLRNEALSFEDNDYNKPNIMIVDRGEWLSLPKASRQKFSGIKCTDKQWLYDCVTQWKCLDYRDYNVDNTNIRKRKRPPTQDTPNAPGTQLSIQGSPSQELEPHKRIRRDGVHGENAVETVESGLPPASEPPPKTHVFIPEQLLRKYPVLMTHIGALNGVLHTSLVDLSSRHVLICERFIPSTTILVGLSRGSLICSEKYLFDSAKAQQWLNPELHVWKPKPQPLSSASQVHFEEDVVMYWHERHRMAEMYKEESIFSKMLFLSLDPTIPQKAILDSTLLHCGAGVITKRFTDATKILEQHDLQTMSIYLLVNAARVDDQRAALGRILDTCRRANLEVKVIRYEYAVNMLTRPRSVQESEYLIPL